MEKGDDAQTGEANKVVTVYHGALDPVKYDTLKVDGPSPNKPFFVTPNRNLAIEAAGGDMRRVLKYVIPRAEATKILGDIRPYLGMLGEGRQAELPGERAILLHRFLDPTQRVSAY